MLNLEDVTLVVVTSVKHEENVKALIKSCDGIKYGKVKYISDIKPHNLPNFVEYVECEKLDYVGFSRYTFLELHKHIDTKFSLLVHHDGFVVNSSLWCDEFFNYDYIGAPWQYSETSYITDNGVHVNVGNGGVEKIKEKIKAYGHQEFNNEYVLSRIEYNVNNNLDIFDRPDAYFFDVSLDTIDPILVEIFKKYYPKSIKGFITYL